ACARASLPCRVTARARASLPCRVTARARASLPCRVTSGRVPRPREEQRALAGHPRRRELLPQPLPEGSPAEGEAAFGAGGLVAEEDVALAAAGRAARDLAGIEDQHRGAAGGEEVGRGGTAD